MSHFYQGYSQLNIAWALVLLKTPKSLRKVISEPEAPIRFLQAAGSEVTTRAYEHEGTHTGYQSPRCNCILVTLIKSCATNPYIGLFIQMDSFSPTKLRVLAPFLSDVGTGLGGLLSFAQGSHT